MTEEEWLYHRYRAIEIGPLGLCSRMRNGLIKVEGQVPMNDAQLSNWIPQRWYQWMEKLRALH